MAGFDDHHSVIKTGLVGATEVEPFRFVKLDSNLDLVHATSAADFLVGVSRIPLGYEDRLKYGEAVPAIVVKPTKPLDYVLFGNGFWLVEMGAAIAAPGWVVCGAAGKAVALPTTRPAPVLAFQLLKPAGNGALGQINMNAVIMPAAAYRSIELRNLST